MKLIANHLSYLLSKSLTSIEEQTSGGQNRRTVCRSVFLTICHCILSAELTKTRSFRQFFFGNFAHWDEIKVDV